MADRAYCNHTYEAMIDSAFIVLYGKIM